MKRPNPTFLKKAEGIKSSRKKRTLIIILSVLVVTFIIVFISSIAANQDTYRLLYPGLIGAAILCFGRFGFLGKMLGGLLAMMVIGNNFKFCIPKP